MKRIISIDGGGIRGVFSLQILKRIELLYRERHAKADLVLADVIDFFAGTSTGAIVATCLSWGMSVDEVERLYVEEGGRMFSRAGVLERWWSKYRPHALADMFRELFLEDDGAPADLGSGKLRTRLLVVMRNATTGSPWPITNNPEALFNDESLADCNLRIPIWQLLRGSTAAPTYFEPERIVLGSQCFLFVDGGVTPYNNPAMLAVLKATLPCYRMNWPTGVDKLHVTSVGTGSFRSVLGKTRASRLRRIGLLDQLKVLPNALLGSVSDQQDLMCRVMGNCIHGHPIDSEIGDQIERSDDAPTRKQFTYVRYNRRLDVVDATTTLPPLLDATLDNLALIPRLMELGHAYAEASVEERHLL